MGLLLLAIKDDLDKAYGNRLEWKFIKDKDMLSHLKFPLSLILNKVII